MITRENLKTFTKGESHDLEIIEIRLIRRNPVYTFTIVDPWVVPEYSL